MTRVYTSGVFDLFHAGHLEALEKARREGDVLVVGILGDEDARSYKRLPVIPYEQRFRLVEGLAIVDEVMYGPKFEQPGFYREHHIDLHCQGDEIEGFYEVARQLGILRILGRSGITDSSQIIQRIADHYARDDLSI